LSERLGRAISRFEAFIVRASHLPRQCRWVNKPVDVTALLADCAIGHTIPRLKVQERHKRSMQLNLFRPKRIVRTDAAAKLDALHDYWTMVAIHAQLALKSTSQPLEHRAA